MSHASTPHISSEIVDGDLIGYKEVCDVRNTSDFENVKRFTAVLRRKYSEMVVGPKLLHF